MELWLLFETDRRHVQAKKSVPVARSLAREEIRGTYECDQQLQSLAVTMVAECEILPKTLLAFLF
jgi:hypothetical protein